MGIPEIVGLTEQGKKNVMIMGADLLEQGEKLGQGDTRAMNDLKNLLMRIMDQQEGDGLTGCTIGEIVALSALARCVEDSKGE